MHAKKSKFMKNKKQKNKTKKQLQFGMLKTL